ncbi:MAG: tripartite tricarboxylate transporter substrate binding protein [Planctomycetota bacterium]|jgi:tripartite-type tricarboxylate transporter receptor subunit TctC|nr:tripartite tricarboxylate transporter substrate binding protein [Planctomycetota bacterium]
MITRKSVGIAAAVLLAALHAGGAGAAGFPQKRIHMTILFGAGAGADLLGRKLADMVAKDLGQNVVCTNRLGGGGAVGYQYVLNTPADGYNICWNSTSINVVHHQGNIKQDYSAFDGVANLTKEASVLAVRSDAPWKSFQEFAEYARANPNTATIANSGVGSFNHLIAAAIEGQAGIKVKHIPLNANESTVALLGGKVDAIVNMAMDVITQQEAGALRALVVVGDGPLEKLPGVPTMKDLGYDLALMMWRGITVPKGTPREVVKILEAAFIKAAETREFKEFGDKYGVIIDTMDAEAFDRLMADSDVIVADIMEKLGIKKQ